MSQNHTFGLIDLPLYATISHADESSAANQSTAILAKYEAQICAAVCENENPIVVIHAATGSGSSKLLQRPLLCPVIKKGGCCLVSLPGKDETVADGHHVIDSAFERTTVDDQEDRLKVTSCSTQGTSVQRAGRVGRVIEGSYLL
jgi:HrpA-like RNA helicase